MTGRGGILLCTLSFIFLLNGNAQTPLSRPIGKAVLPGHFRFIYNSDGNNMFLEAPPLMPEKMYSYIDEVAKTGETGFLISPNWRVGKAGDSILLVANKHSNTLSFVNSKTFEVIETIPTGPNPHEITVIPDQKTAYLSSYEPPGNTISVIDVATRKEIKRVRVGDYAIGVELSPGERYAFVGREDSMAPEVLPDGSERVKEHKEDSDGIHVIDMKTLEVVSIIKTGLGPDPMMMWYPPEIIKD